MEESYKIEEAAEFKNPKGRFTPLISIGGTGGVGISAGFTKKYEFNDQNTKGIKFFYWKEKNAIGLLFLKEEEDGMMKPRFSDNERGGAYINALALWSKFDIDFGKYVGKYLPKAVQTPKGTVYVIELGNFWKE